MKPTRKNVAITAGLTAVLALSPVMVPVVSTFAEDSGDTAAAQSVMDTKKEEYKEVSDSVAVHTVRFYDGEEFLGAVTRGGDQTLSTYLNDLVADLDREGYTLMGWATGSGDEVLTTETISGDITLYAQWRKDAASLNTVVFYDGDVRLGAVTKGGDQTLEQYVNDLALFNDLNREGYSLHWVTKSGDEVLTTDTISGDITLYARYEKNAAVYTVNFFDEDGKGICTIALAGDNTLADFVDALYETDDVEVPFKDGCYIEWTTGSGDVILPTDTIQGTLNLYVNFRQSPATHTVNFFDEEGNGLGTIGLTGDQPLTAYTDALAEGGIEAPYKEGYTFTGWTTKSGDAVLPTDIISGDLNLYASYTKNAAVHTINFFDEDGNGLGTIANAGDVAFSVYTDMLAEGVQVPEKDGFIFAGWVTASGDKILATDIISGDLNVYASYEEVSEPETVYHKVTFDDCLDSTENVVVVVEDGKVVNKPADPTCEGYTFLGWFSDTALTQAYDFSSPVSEDMTLWAKWEKNADATTPADDAETPSTPSEDAAEDGLPSTGDAAFLVAGVAGLGAAITGAGAYLKRRRG